MLTAAISRAMSRAFSLGAKDLRALRRGHVSGAFMLGGIGIALRAMRRQGEHGAEGCVAWVGPRTTDGLGSTASEGRGLSLRPE